jgi:hypothetical protein
MPIKSLSLTLPRWSRRSTLLGSTGGLRLDCTPPSLQHMPGGLWQRLLFWLLAPAPHEAAPPLDRLPAVRTDFLAAMADITGDDAEDVRWGVHHARSLRELWHLRTDVFRLVAVASSQAEAEQRLLLLNRHFPTRAPRSQFGAL